MASLTGEMQFHLSPVVALLIKTQKKDDEEEIRAFFFFSFKHPRRYINNKSSLEAVDKETAITNK